MATPIIPGFDFRYCLPNPINLTVQADTGVTRSDAGVIFRVAEPSFSLHNRRVLHDVSGNPVLTLYDKLMTMHGRRRVFQGASTNSDNLLFSVKRPSTRKPRNRNIDLEVFLAKNTEERDWDFKVNACPCKNYCFICRHGSSTILARMRNRVEVEVEPNVDHAFIVALITIVHEIDASEGTGDAAVSACWCLNIGANVADALMNFFQ